MSRIARPGRLRVCVVTGARSEYGMLSPVMRELRGARGFSLRTAATGAHLCAELGSTYREIEADGFALDAKVRAPMGSRSPLALTRAVGAWTRGFGAAFSRLKPDIVLVMGDRYELLAVGAACTILGIPLAHISGGEITEGAIDDQIRHALTKLAHLHFVANEVYAGRLRQMGEEPWRICVSGDPGLDGIRDQFPLSRRALGARLGLDLSLPTALVTFHPVTHELRDAGRQAAELAAALGSAGLQYVVTYPNADAGGDRIIRVLRAFAARYPRAKLFASLGRERYLPMLRHARLMIGNSSSGLVEAPAFNLPVVNVGTRQDGRMRGRNVIDTACRRGPILDGIRAALAYDRAGGCDNPYGDGRSSPRIRRFLEEVFASRTREDILKKRFIDRPGRAAAGPAPVGGAFETDLAHLASGRAAPLERGFNLGPHHALLASGRAALRFILADLDPGRRPVLLPDYLCGDVLLPVLRGLGLRWRFYPVRRDLGVDEDALRRLVRDGCGAVLLIDYFGLCEFGPLAARIRSWDPSAPLIADCVQALYEFQRIPPQRHWADYAFASLRKFVGVPDGAFVRAKRPLRPPAPDAARPDQSLSALLGGLLKGESLGGRLPDGNEAEGAFLRLFARAAREVPAGPVGMLPLSRAVAESLPFEAYARRRRENYQDLARRLAGIEGLTPVRPDLPRGRVPMFFPVRTDPGLRDRLRAFLAARRIYCPVHWPSVPKLPGPLHRGSALLARTTLSLVIDQRYDAASMQRLSAAVRAFFDGRISRRGAPRA